MAPSQFLSPRSDPSGESEVMARETREEPGTADSFGDTTWAVVAIVLGAFLMVTLVIFSVLYYLRWRQLTRAAATAASARGGEGGGDQHHQRRRGHPWEEPPPADAQLRHHRSRLRLDPAAAMVGSLTSAAGPKRLRKMTSEDQAEAHELERALMIRKSLASRESWGSHASHHTLVSSNHSRSVSGGSSNSNNSNISSGGGGDSGGDSSSSSNTTNKNAHETDACGTAASHYRSHDSLKSWEAGAEGSRRNSRVVLPAVSAESLRGHPALEAVEAAAAAGPRPPSVPPAPAGLQRKLMSPLPPLPNAHTR